MLLVGLVAAAGAALAHVFIFILESLRWTEEPTRKIFGVRSEKDAETMKTLAFNQGFYNLFLAIAAVLGIVLVLMNHLTVGVTLVLTACGMMLAAAVVLFASNRKMARAAAMQGGMPLLAIVMITLAILTA